MQSIVIVGASLAGCRAAEALREEGFVGRVVVIGDEPHPPYDRPPLSKQVLAGSWDTDRIALPAAGAALDLDWRLGARATGLDFSARRITLTDGSQVAFDGLVIATGATPRTVPVPDGMAGVHTLRTLDDCLALRGELDAAPRRVVVVGAGFIGAEVAATCRERGLEVTMVEALPAPLARVLGEVIGGTTADLHRDHGVDVRTGVGVAALTGGARVERVELGDGSAVDADVVVVGVGVTPVTGWLEGSGLTLEDGVLCDETCLAAPGVVAAGDVARWPNRTFGETMRVEHWDNALDQGAHAARRLLAGEGPGTPYAPVPWFWSDQYDRKLQLAGRPGPGDDVALVQGSLEERRFVALFGRAGRVTAAFGMNRPAPIMRYRARIADGLSWDEALAEAEVEAEAPPDERFPGTELVDVVDERGRVVDTVTRAEMRRRNLRHRTVFVAVVATDGERLLVHRRAEWKDTAPGWWDVAFGGVVGAGEGWNDAAARELQEEAGVVAALEALGEDSYEDGTVAEVCRVYRARSDGPFTFADGEVVEVAWVDLVALPAWLEGRLVCPDSVAVVLPRVAVPA